MFKHLLEWHDFKKKLLTKYKEQISSSLYQKTNRSLLITAVKMGNSALFKEIISSPFLNKALMECDSDNKNALYYALSCNNNFYECLLSKDAVLSTFPNESDEMVVLKYQELSAYRKKSSPRGYRRYFKRLKEQIEQMYNIDHEAMNGNSLMTIAVKNKDTSMVNYLLSLNASPLSGHIDVEATDLNAYELAVYGKCTDIQQRLHQALFIDGQQEMAILANKKCATVKEAQESGKRNEIVWNYMGLIFLGTMICTGLHDCSMKTSEQNSKPIPTQTQKRLPIKNIQTNERQ